MSQHPALPYLRNSEKGKIVTAAEAVRLVREGDTIATGGFVGIGFAEEIAVALEQHYLSSADDALVQIERGFRFVSVGSDTRMLAAATAAAYEKVRNGLLERKRA